ncbi:Kelch domain-containing protein 8B, partial [Xenoophorus captivus]
NEPSPLGSVESYNPVKRRWEYVAPMPTARCSSALLQTASILFVIGGVAQGPSNAKHPGKSASRHMMSFSS